MNSLQSDQINELATALAKAQAEIGSVHKDQDNPYFRSKFASLSTVWETVKPALTKHGISIVQMPGSDERGYFVQTQLMHGSGQWIRSTTYMKPAKEDPQGIGSLISYARRYALQAMVMACPEDDDAEAAMGRTRNVQQLQPAFVKADDIKVVKKEEPKPVKQEEPKVESGTSKFNGPSHQELFQSLMKEGHTQDDFMAAMRHSGAIPAAAKDYFAMKEGTADKFLKELEKTTNVIIEWKALVK